MGMYCVLKALYLIILLSTCLFIFFPIIIIIILSRNDQESRVLSTLSCANHYINLVTY